MRDATADAELDPNLGFDVLLGMRCGRRPATSASARWSGWVAQPRLLGGYLRYEPYRARLGQVLADRLPELDAPG